MLSGKDTASFHEALSRASRISVVTHQHPDGDAVGSTVAILHYIRKHFNTGIRIIYPEKYSASLSFIAGNGDSRYMLDASGDPEQASGWISACDMIICLDCRGFERTGALGNILRDTTAYKVLIDHHLNPAIEEFDLVFSDIEVSSASELLFSILSSMPEVEGNAKRLPKRSLYAITTGILTDTNNFANSIFPGTMTAVSRLLDAGVDRDSIQNHIYNEHREARVRLMGHLMYENMKITEQGAAYMILTKETAKRFRIKEGELEGLVNIPLTIRKVRMSLFLREEEDRFRVSIRSKRGTSANRCAAEYFNGGGHELAAGGKLRIPEDIPCRDAAAAYIEEKTGRFLGK